MDCYRIKLSREPSSFNIHRRQSQLRQVVTRSDDRIRYLSISAALCQLATGSYTGTNEPLHQIAICRFYIAFIQQTRCAELLMQFSHCPLRMKIQAVDRFSTQRRQRQRLALHTGGLNHLTMINKAHRLLRRYTQSYRPDIGRQPE